MIRIILIEVLLLLLPFFVYAAWRFVVHEARGGAVMNDAPVLLLMTLGLIFFAAGLFHFASYETEGVDGRYVPAKYQDGQLIPGHFEHSGDAAGAGGQ